jgi:hypothetical protein
VLVLAYGIAFVFQGGVKEIPSIQSLSAFIQGVHEQGEIKWTLYPLPRLIGENRDWMKIE